MLWHIKSMVSTVTTVKMSHARTIRVRTVDFTQGFYFVIIN